MFTIINRSNTGTLAEFKSGSLLVQVAAGVSRVNREPCFSAFTFGGERRNPNYFKPFGHNMSWAGPPPRDYWTGTPLPDFGQEFALSAIAQDF
jgi:hypothetical protein